MKHYFIYFLLTSTVFFACDIEEEPITYNTDTFAYSKNSQFTTTTGDIFTLESNHARGERFSGPDRFLVYANQGKSRWEVFTLIREGKFKSDITNSLVYMPDSTDNAKMYSVAAGRADIRIFDLNSDSTVASVSVIGTAHNSKIDSVNFECIFTEVPLHMR